MMMMMMMMMMMKNCFFLGGGGGGFFFFYCCLAQSCCSRLEQRRDHALAPLQRAVRRGDRAGGLELGARRQQIHAVLAHHRRHRRGGRRIGIDDDEQCRASSSPRAFPCRASGCSAHDPRTPCARRFESWSIRSFFSSTPSIQRDTVMPGFSIIACEANCFLIHS